MGVVSMRDLVTGTTYFKAVVCPADSYGINGPDPATGVFKKYGRTVTPCTACPANMLTAQYATPEENAANKITGYLTKSGAGNLGFTNTPYSAAGGYYSIDACATRVSLILLGAVQDAAASTRQAGRLLLLMKHSIDPPCCTVLL
jgi:hypothetical protein